MTEKDNLRRALVLLARALPVAEAHLVHATAGWRPERATAYKAMYKHVQVLRAELQRLANELDRLGR